MVHKLLLRLEKQHSAKVCWKDAVNYRTLICCINNEMRAIQNQKEYNVWHLFGIIDNVVIEPK